MSTFNISIEKVGYLSDVYVTLSQCEAMRLNFVQNKINKAIQNKMK